MQGASRAGLGLRPSQPVHTNSPAHPSQQMTLFVGSISAGITDLFLQALFQTCGQLRGFKRLLTPIGKPQGFGFAEFEQPESMLRAIQLLNGLELPSQESGQPNKKLLVRADEKTGNYLKAYESTRIKTDQDEQMTESARSAISGLLDTLRTGQPLPLPSNASDSASVIPPHLHDLQEADLPENQRGLVISEIELFRRRAVKKASSDKTAGVGPINAVGGNTGFSAPREPRERWGQRQGSMGGGGGSASGPPTPQHQRQTSQPRDGQFRSTDPQSYRDAPEFVKSEVGRKNDEERDRDLRAKKLKADDQEFKHRERIWENAEFKRIKRFSHMAAVEAAVLENEEKDRQDMKERLEIWDDDESDELFYVDRAEWRRKRRRVLARELADDNHARNLARAEEERAARESAMFLERQMEEMRATQEEQKRSGLLVDDAAPIKLNVKTIKSDVAAPPGGYSVGGVVFGPDEEEDMVVKKKRVPLQKLDFVMDEEKAKEKLEGMRVGVTRERESLFKAKVRWEAISDSIIDKKIEPLIGRKIEQYLGEVDDDLVMFVLEHIKDHKPPSKLVEELQSVLVDEAVPFVIAIWRQIIFESVAYGEGLETGSQLVDD